MNKIIVFITLLLLICGCFVSCTPNAIGDTDRESESTQKADGSEDSNITPGTNQPADSSSGSSDSALYPC